MLPSTRPGANKRVARKTSRKGIRVSKSESTESFAKHPMGIPRIK